MLAVSCPIADYENKFHRLLQAKLNYARRMTSINFVWVLVQLTSVVSGTETGHPVTNSRLSLIFQLDYYIQSGPGGYRELKFYWTFQICYRQLGKYASSNLSQNSAYKIQLCHIKRDIS